MTQKILAKDLSQTELLQSIERKGIAEESMGQTVEILLNLRDITESNRAVTIRSQRITGRKSRVKRLKQGIEGRKGSARDKSQE
jgi:hypothetical protein